MKKIFRRIGALLCAFALCLTYVSALSVEEALELLEEYYIHELPAEAYEAKTLEELFEIIDDPYTYYMTEEEYKKFLADLEHSTTVTGIGSAIEYTEDGILLTSILRGGSADEAGLKNGDLIIAIDGVSCVPANESFRVLVIGEEGTWVTLTVKHPDGTVEDYHIQRKTVTIYNTTVDYDEGTGVGHISCTSFGSQTESYVSEGVSEYSDARLWVFDVRSNPGGLAVSSVVSVGVFSGEGVKLHYRTAADDIYRTLFLKDALTEAPVIALVNGFSASAAEVFSGGVRAEKCGIVVGSRTYGKGTAQVVFDHDDFPELFQGDALKLTTYRFYCGDGNTTDMIGVIPTLLVDDKYTADVAELLSATPADGAEYLELSLNGKTFFLVPSAAKAAGKDAALTELLSALPPDAALTLCDGGARIPIRSAEALSRWGDVSASRCFRDVSASPYANAIDTLGVYRILRGSGNGAFVPEGTLTRAELAAMLVQAANLRPGKAPAFSDVAESAWYAETVDAAVSAGFMQGVGDGKFDPGAALTQEQFLTVMGRLARFLNLFADEYALELPEEALADESLARFASWSRTSLRVLTDYDGDMLYAPLETIDPGAPVTRAEAAAMLYNIFTALHVLSY